MKTTGDYKCEICPAVFKTQKGLDNHKCRWICRECGAKLKTQKGFEKHIENHKASIQVKTEREIAETKRKEEEQREFEIKFNELKSRGLFVPKYKPGDKVIISTYHVTKPTHVEKFGRMRRVRYEEERRYYADIFTVESIIEPTLNDLWLVGRSLGENTQYEVKYRTIKYGKRFTKDDVFDNMDDACAHADIESRKYKEACEFASMCR